MNTAALVQALMPFVICFLSISIDGRFFLPGVVVTIAEVILEFIIFVDLRSLRFNFFSVVIPILFLIGDAAYGITNYLLHLPIPNQFGCLIYVIPYLLGMVFLSVILSRLLIRRLSEEKKYVRTAISLFVLFWIFVLTKVITIPALTEKSPPLNFILQVLTAGYSVAEGYLIGVTCSLIMFSASAVLQAGLFGVLLMHISDIAIRYQSVDLSQLGMSFFENGWLIGLALVAYATKLNKVRINTALRWDPFASIRGTCIVSGTFISFLTWTVYCFYFGKFAKPYEVTGSLLVVLLSLGFSTAVANFVGRQIKRIALGRGRTNTRSVEFVPIELSLMAAQFEKLGEMFITEKKKILNLTSHVAHDMRAPLAALKTIVPLISDQIGNECGCKEVTEDSLKILNMCTDSVQKLAREISRNREEILERQDLTASIQAAVSICSHAFPKAHIVIEGAISSTILLPKSLRVVTNLVQNAIEASNDSPIFIILGETPETAFIKVKNRGTRITGTNLEKLRSGEVFTTKPGGSGIGFSSMTSWCRDYSLRFEIESDDVETVVTISVPKLLSLFNEADLGEKN